MNIELIKALEIWANAGSRQVKITFENRYGWAGFEETTSYWLYDFDLQKGKYVNSIKDIPTTNELRELNS